MVLKCFATRSKRARRAGERPLTGIKRPPDSRFDYRCPPPSKPIGPRPKGLDRKIYDATRRPGIRCVVGLLTRGDLLVRVHGGRPRAKRALPCPTWPAQYGRNEYRDLPAKSPISSEESANVSPLPLLPTPDQYRGYVWDTVDFISVGATVAVATRSASIGVADLWRQPEAVSAGPQNPWGSQHPNCRALICGPRSGCVHPGALTSTQSNHSCPSPVFTIVVLLRRPVGSLRRRATLGPARAGAHWIAGSSAVAPGASVRARL